MHIYCFEGVSSQLWCLMHLAIHTTDQGGPYRDSMSRIGTNICSTRLPLFVLCPNGRTNSGSNRDRLILNVFPPNKPILNRMKKQSSSIINDAFIYLLRCLTFLACQSHSIPFRLVIWLLEKVFNDSSQWIFPLIYLYLSLSYIHSVQARKSKRSLRRSTCILDDTKSAVTS
jgi:hypothetical protein